MLKNIKWLKKGRFRGLIQYNNKRYFVFAEFNNYYKVEEFNKSTMDSAISLNGFPVNGKVIGYFIDDSRI